jgi:cold shock CspA family protein
VCKFDMNCDEHTLSITQHCITETIANNMAAASNAVSTSMDSTATRRNMRVRWFDQRKGYGFLVPTNQALESDTQDETVFVYHNQVRTFYKDNIFRMLFAGEYVSCEISTDESGRTVANNVTGVGDGPLLCEVRAMNSQARSSDDTERPRPHARGPSGGGRGRGRGRGRAPRSSGPSGKVTDPDA